MRYVSVWEQVMTEEENSSLPRKRRRSLGTPAKFDGRIQGIVSMSNWSVCEPDCSQYADCADNLSSFCWWAV